MLGACRTPMLSVTVQPERHRRHFGYICQHVRGKGVSVVKRAAAKQKNAAGRKKQGRSLPQTRLTTTPFLPSAMVLFLKRSGWRLVAAILFAAGVATILALASYNPLDPSLNHETGAAATNWLGSAGAIVADILMQTIGLAGYAIALAMFGWAWQLVRLRGMPWFWLHLAALPLALICLASVLEAFAAPSTFIPKSGYGGSVGELIFFKLVMAELVKSIVPANMLFLAYYTVIGLFSLLGLALLAYSLALTPQEWARIRAQLTALALWLYYIIRDGVSWFFHTLAYKFGGHKATTSVAGAASVSVKQRKKRTRREPLMTTSPAADKKGRIAKPAKPRKGAREGKERQITLDFGDGNFILPALDLLTSPPASATSERLSADALEANARMLEGVLDDFGVSGEITEVRPGPVVTLYELEPAAGVKTARVIGLADDIARSMSAVSARVARVPGQTAIGIELPNVSRETVYLRELLASRNYETTRAALPLTLGKDIGGAPIIADLATMPHLLVAGTTGAGKSVGINTMILSLLYRLSPEQCRFIMVDPKMLELSIYDDIPHLLTPVVVEAKKAVVALKWAVREMEERYQNLSKLGVRNITAFNDRVRKAKAEGEELKRTVQTGFDKETGQPVYEEQVFDFDVLPYIVIVIDEMADLMLVAGKDVEATVQRLAQMARAAGLHLIMATQRPSVDVITGTIKANFPTRISFQVTSKIDSRTILGEQGAEQLLGRGDMLYMAGGGRITRVHGAFVADDEVENIVKHIKKQGQPDYIAAVTEEPEGGFDSPFIPGSDGSNGEQTLYDQAVDVVLRDRRPTTSYIQRRLKIGYNKAASLIEEMEENGVISAPNAKGQREVLVPEREEF